MTQLTVSANLNTSRNPVNKRQTDKTSSYASLKIILEQAANKAIWSALPAFERGVTQFYGSMNVLAALAQAQGTPTTGIAVDKSRIAQSLINRTLEISGAVSAYAEETKDATLQSSVTFSKSELKDLRDPELDDQAQAVHDIAAGLVAENAVKMGEYGLTAVKLADLQSAITAYSELVGGPRAAIKGKVAVTRAIEAEFARADRLLTGQLDKLVVQFETAHPQFVTTYRAGRVIAASGGRSASDESATPAPAPKPVLQPV
jgi:hypothetical protein